MSELNFRPTSTCRIISRCGVRNWRSRGSLPEQRHGLKNWPGKFSIPHVADDYRRLLERKDIDAVDLCVPTDLHHEFIIQAAQAGKHVICEKPLTGYFGKERPEDLVGFAVDRGTMLQEALANCKAVATAIEKNKIKFCYAENWVYAPPVVKLKNLIRASQGTILDIRAEESHSGSHAAYSRRWKTSGGGALLRLGAHPVSAVLHLKHYEGMLQQGRGIRLKSVTAEVGRHTVHRILQEGIAQMDRQRLGGCGRLGDDDHEF